MTKKDSRYYSFFVLDDQARWRSFCFSISSSALGAVLLLLIGLPEAYCLYVATALMLIVFSFRLWSYKAKVLQPTLHTTQRRRFLSIASLPLLGSLDWLADWIGSASLGRALAFGETSRDALASRSSIPVREAAYYKAVITSRFSRVPSRQRQSLRSAYAIISAAQDATIAYKGALPIRLRLGATPGTQLPYGSDAVHLMGSGHLESKLVYVGRDPELFDTERNLVLDNLVLVGPQSSVFTRPQLVAPADDVVIVITGCLVQNFSQDLARVSCSNTLFEACEITLAHSTVLVNVSFVSCQVKSDDVVLTALGQADLNNASGVTFADPTENA